MKKLLTLLLLMSSLFSCWILASDYYVVGEVFSATWCPYCPAAQAGLEQLYDQHERVIPLVWYTGTSITSPGASTRVNLYGVGPIPHTQFGGTIADVGGGNAYPRFLNHYNGLLNYNSPMSIEMNLQMNAQGQVVVNSTVEITGAFTETNNRIYTLLTLDGPGNPRFLVVRYAEQAFNLTTVGDSQTYTQAFDLDPSWSIESLRAVSIVQTLGNPKRILQANYTGFTGMLANFTADIFQGPPSLIVNFRDLSLPQNGIQAWAWDFNNDGVTDSTDPNPTHVYDTPGVYTVSLTITTDEGEDTFIYDDMITVLDSGNVSGLVAGNWTNTYSPYIITEDIEVPEGLELNINPGVDIIVEDNVSIIVKGKITVIGEKGNEVRFTSDTSWKGILLQTSPEIMEFKYVIFKNANNGAIRSSMTNFTVEGCSFINNTSTIVGPAIDLSSSNNVVITGSYFANNFSSNSGGAINMAGSNLVLKNSVLVNNTGRNAGSIFVKNSSNISIENCTIYNNLYTFATGGNIMSSSSTTTIVNSIINGEIPVYDLNSLIEVTYSCITTDGGMGNINLNPQFINSSNGIGHEFATDYLNWVLSENSPCIDSGNPDQNYNDIEDTTNPGSALFPARGNLRNDMGAFGGNGGTNWVPIDDNSSVNLTNFINLQTYPNPFNPNLNIQVDLKKSLTPLNISIFNVKGQKVAELMNVIPKSNSFTLTWNGKDDKGNSLSSGVYFVKAISSEEINVKKVLMLK